MLCNATKTQAAKTVTKTANPNSKKLPTGNSLQRAVGNNLLKVRAENTAPPRVSPEVQRKCASCCSSCQEEEKHIQTKLKIGATNDPLEAEADQVASQVMGMSTPAAFSAAAPELMTSQTLTQRRSQATNNEKVKPNLPTPTNEAELSSGGAPLAPGLRQFFETRFGRDLSDVRVHTGAHSSAWNDGLHSHAFTYGSHIWLGGSHTPSANFLFAHELAHVVQQTQPNVLDSATANIGDGNISMASSAEHSIQRLGLSDPFWIPLGASGKLSGSDIHRDLLGAAQKNNGNLKIEAPAPNANRNDWGLGLQGSIDLYLGDTMPGLYFDGKPAGEQHPANPELATAKKHYRAALKGPNAASFKPWVKGKNIEDIASGPNNPKMGELKPAVKSMLDKGDTQLTNYENGFKMAADLTNAWATRNGKKGEQWKLGTPGRIPSKAVDFSDGGKDMSFNPLSPRDDTTLVLGTIAESSSRGGKYEHKVLFNPAKYGLPPIKGGLYAQNFTGGKGLWMYFARPKNLNDALKLARSALLKGEMTYANQVQDQVINPILKAPKKTSVKAAKKITKKSKNFKKVPQYQFTPTAPVIQRAPKIETPTLEDEFNYTKWVTDQRALRQKISGPGAAEDTKKQVASMELLHQAYKTETALDKVPGTGKTSLPAKSADMVNVVTSDGTTKTTHKKELADLGGWLKGWSGKPAEALGYFRDKFGGAFTTVANKFITLRDRIRDKLKSHFEDKSGVKGKSGKAKMILQALGKAVKQIAKILLPRTFHLVLEAIEAGTKKKLKKIFDIDPQEMLNDKFGEPFAKLSVEVEAYKKKANTFVTEIFDKYTGDLKWLQDVIDLGKKIGPVLEAAAAGIQCISPPGWGCLKLLARKLTDCAIAKAMNICKVQKEIAELTISIDSLRNLPVLLGGNIMEVLKTAAPKDLKEIFDEPLPKPPDFNVEDIECEFTELPSGCPDWGLIELDGGVGAPGKDGEGEDEENNKGKEAESGEQKPKPQQQPQQKTPGGTPPKTTDGPSESEAEQKKRDDFFDKITKEELDELYREAQRQGLMDKPFTVEKAEELLKKAKENIRKAKEAARKRREERKRKAAEEKAKGDAEKEKSKGQENASGAACSWDSSSLAVSGVLMNPHALLDSRMGDWILDEGYSSGTPFKQKEIFSCGGFSDLTLISEFLVGRFCARPGSFTVPIVSADIRFKSASGENELFKKTTSNASTDGIYVNPPWSRINLGSINTNGELKIELSMKDPDTGITRKISATIPVNVNCT